MRRSQPSVSRAEADDLPGKTEIVGNARWRGPLTLDLELSDSFPASDSSSILRGGLKDAWETQAFISAVADAVTAAKRRDPAETVVPPTLAKEHSIYAAFLVRFLQFRMLSKDHLAWDD